MNGIVTVFDGHNDTLMQLKTDENGVLRLFLTKAETGHLDLPRACRGGFGGGMFAIMASPKMAGMLRDNDPDGNPLADPPPALPVDKAIAQQAAEWGMARLQDLVSRSEGKVAMVTDMTGLRGCFENSVLAAVLHFEGAEPVDPSLDNLEDYYNRGLRSLGIVWSRPTEFCDGVLFRFPGSPDTGGGLTDAGRELVTACNQLGILLDLSHITEHGFWDIARLSTKPLVATHSCVHAICPSSRNLTDKQLDAIAESGGLVGINFAVYFLRTDGRPVSETPVDVLVDHIEYIADRNGVDHVALGSDFDGALIPMEIKDAAGLQTVIRALKRRGFSAPDIQRIARENWFRVLEATWRV